MADETPPRPVLIGPAAVSVVGSTAGKQSDGLIMLTLYGTASVSDFKSSVPVVVFAAALTPQAAQNLLTNLDGALMADAKPAQKED